jgi:hypothetical protein
MPSLFGYAKYPQRPSPDRRQVGEALLLQNMNGGAGADPGMAPSMATPAPAPDAAAVGDPAEHDLRMQGGRQMGGAGQGGWGSGDGDSAQNPNPSAIAAAVGEALTRQGGGIMRDRNPFLDRERRKRDVLRLGISELEAELLSQSGGL